MTRSFPRFLPACLLAAALAPARAPADVLPATTCPGTSAGRTCTLVAKPGAVVLPGLGPVTIWGYASTAAGAATSPGPVLVVNQGDVVTLSLTNGLGVATSVGVTGQVAPPALAGVGPGATGTFRFVAGTAGTFLYEAGVLPGTQYQPAMGLYGVLVVRPTPAPATPQAFADAASAYDDEAVVVLSEIDPALNGAANPAAFDMRTFAPKYGLVNGRPHPDTAPIPTAPGRRVLLRYANAGLEPRSMALLGASQTTLAVSGGRTAAPHRVVAQEIPAGQSADALVIIPASAQPGTRYALYEGALSLHNGSAPGVGGMLTFLAAGTGAPLPGVGPVTSAVAVAPSPMTGASNATVNATVTSNGSTVAGAELFIDAPGAPGTGAAVSAVDGTFNGTTEAVRATLASGLLGALATGPHPVYVRGRDATGVWGPVASAVLLLDHTGPAIAALSVSPAATAGASPVAVAATGDDRATGGAAVVAAEYTINGAGPATAMAAGPVGDVTSFTASISAARVGALADGSHTVAVRARDQLGNWGPLRPATLVLDRVGPAVSSVAVTPALTDGTRGYSSGNPSLRVTATVGDPAGIAAAEGFVDAAGAPGTGFPLIPADGQLDGTSEGMFADVPLSTVVQLPAGTHAILVRGRDRAGNWGTQGSGSFVYDPSGALFADGFESGTLAAWNGGVTGAGLAATAAARLGPSGSFGLALTLGGTTARYLTDNTPSAEKAYRARFLFDPNSAGSTNAWTIFAGQNGAQVPFTVQYRRPSSGQYQLRIQLLTTTGLVSSAYVNVSDAPHTIEVTWNAGSGAGPRLRMWIDGAVSRTLSGQDTTPYRIESVRLGRSAGNNGSASGTLYFDGFASSRGQTLAP